MSFASRDTSAPDLRARLAGRAAVYVGQVSRRMHLGAGSVIGGRFGLMMDPDLLRALGAHRTIALVSGTNGKTTTTRLLAAALGAQRRVATSPAGANLPSGLVVALASSEPGAPAVLEVDEGYLPRVVDALAPAAVALLNLSRDQLDRVSEVRMVAERWREGLAVSEGTLVVANADDPLVAWAAGSARRVTWVAAGQLWHSDSVGCPACGGRIVFADDTDGDTEPESAARGDERARLTGGGDWSCSCGLRRPRPDAWLEGDELVISGGRRLKLRLSLPGRCNRANAAIAAVCAAALGVDPAQALESMSDVTDVEGRFATVELEGRTVRLLLAKNPAGWTELLDLISGRTDPVVIGINARVADGHDPSWLWDVPFEQLGDRAVVATGERCRDLAVRLRHAGVAHRVLRGQLEALRAAGARRVDYVGNYTAFQQVRRALSLAPTASTHPLDSALPGAGPVGIEPAAPIVRTSVRAGDGVSALRVVVVHPDLLGTYGDGGNGRVLADRAAWRGVRAELVLSTSDRPLPAGADLYCLGGGEDLPQVQSAELLTSGPLQKAVEAGAVVLAVCAGYQILGRSFPDARGELRPGVGLLDVYTVKGGSRRAVGEVLAEPLALPDPWSALGLSTPSRLSGATSARPQSAPSAEVGRLGILTGFENHGGVTRIGPGVSPLARVISGTGNGTGDGTEGAVFGRTIGTYMHGPVLARNPLLADLLLSMATGSSLAPLEDSEEEALRVERIAALRSDRLRLRLRRSRAGTSRIRRGLVIVRKP